MKLKFGIIILTLGVIDLTCAQLPLVLTTWGFKNSTQKAWDVLHDNLRTSLDALVEGCLVCEQEQCDGTVGYGGSPDENGETTLDAFIMDGSNMNIGAVAGLRQIKNAIVVARHVLQNTKHSLLVGDLATDFAVMMGMKKEPLSTDKSRNLWRTWRNKNCQPNFWMNVIPDPEQNCGPYVSAETCDNENSVYNDKGFSRSKFKFGAGNHDTIGMIIIDKEFQILAGTSTNGAKYKIPGRVGDSPIPGAGAYADNTVGAAVSTGDGDIMMRFLPSFTAVEGLRRGLSAKNAALEAIMRIIKYHPNFVGGIIVARKDGQYSAACHGMKEFPFSVYQVGQTNVIVKTVECV